MILKLAGTSGSGKSSLIRALMKLWKFTPETWPGKLKVKQYTAKVAPGEPLSIVYDRVVVLGDYTTPCGGMDGVSDKNDRHAMTAAYASKKFKRTLVLAEGLLYGGVYGVTEGLGVLSEEKSSGLWTYAFMNTPIEVCLERVKARRLARGVTKPMNPKNTTDKHRCIVCVEARVRAGAKPNHLVHVVDYKLTPARAAKALCAALEVYEQTHR
jgi:ABC-type dipeptide/oligopeptide/nickel transport system ATPase component